jgi:hypothetical protein
MVQRKRAVRDDRARPGLGRDSYRGKEEEAELQERSGLPSPDKDLGRDFLPRKGEAALLQERRRFPNPDKHRKRAATSNQKVETRKSRRTLDSPKYRITPHSEKLNEQKELDKMVQRKRAVRDDRARPDLGRDSYRGRGGKAELQERSGLPSPDKDLGRDFPTAERGSRALARAKTVAQPRQESEESSNVQSEGRDKEEPANPARDPRLITQG